MAGPWEKFQINPHPIPASTAPGPWQKFSLDDVPPDTQMGNVPPSYKPGGVQDFFGTIADDLGGIIPNLAHTAKGLATHPVDTGGAMVNGLIHLPDTIGDEWKKEGRPGKAFAHIAELAAPLALKGAGKLMEGTARPLVKSALGLPGKAEAYGATPAKAVLEETNGVRPSTIAASAQKRIGELNTELEGRAAASNNPVSLARPRSIIDEKSAKAAGANSEATPRELVPMRDQLTEARPGFSGATAYPPGAHTPVSFPAGMTGQPLGIVRGASPTMQVAEEQSPLDYLGMKRQFDKDFIRNWSPAANTKGALGVARQAYGSMADEFNAAVPGAADLNQRISSLIPAGDRARLVDMNAGPGERILNRVARPTGALAPAIMGYHEGGLPGLFGAITGQEALSSPTVKMMGARTLYGLGRGAEATGNATRPLVMAQPELTRRRP